MMKILSYPLSVLYHLSFGLVLVVFHPIQWICLKFSYQAHKKSVDFFNFCLLKCHVFLGTRFHFDKSQLKLPENAPVIIVSNHQSLYDISPISWHLRALHPKFISKKELGKGIPSVSFNLRHGGSVLIDRKNPREALTQIKDFTKYLNTNKRSGVVFPEGTRSRDGKPRVFHKSGLKILFAKMPSAYVLPISINNSWKLQKNGMLPMPLGVKVSHKVHPPMKVSDYSIEELLTKVEQIIKKDITS